MHRTPADVTSQDLCHSYDVPYESPAPVHDNPCSQSMKNFETKEETKLSSKENSRIRSSDFEFDAVVYQKPEVVTIDTLTYEGATSAIELEGHSVEVSNSEELSYAERSKSYFPATLRESIDELDSSIRSAELQLRKFKGDLDTTDFFSLFHFDNARRKRLKRQYVHFKQSCASLKEVFYNHKATAEWLGEDEDEAIQSVLLQNHSLVLLGQSNSGKTFIINELLGDIYLPVAENPCQVGIVLVKYAHDGDYIGLRPRVLDVPPPSEALPKNVDISCGQEKQPCQLISSFIQSVRKNPKLADQLDSLTLYFEIGLKNRFLRSGVELVDTPGIELCVEYPKRLIDLARSSSLQATIYTIDGNRSLNESDRSFLYNLRTSCPNLKVYYVVNKVDYDPHSIKMDLDSDSDESDSEDCDQEKSIQERGMKLMQEKELRVYNNLVRNQLLRDVPLENCTNFSSMSAVEVLNERLVRNQGKGHCQLQETDSDEEIEITEEDHPRTWQFLKMQAGFLQLCCKNLHLNFRRAASTMYLVQRRLFVLFTSNPFEENHNYTKLAEFIEEKFRQIKDTCHEKEKTFADKFKQTVSSQGESILQGAAHMDFQPIRIKEFVRRNEIVIQCRDQVKHFVLIKVNEILDRDMSQDLESISEELMSKLRDLLKQVRQNLPQHFVDVEETLADDTHIELSAMFNYMLDGSVLTPGRVDKCKIMWKDNVKTLFSDKATTIDAQWKNDVAVACLTELNQELVAEKVFASLYAAIEHSERRLQRYIVGKKNMQKLLNKKLELVNCIPMMTKLQDTVLWNSVQSEALNTLTAHGQIPVGDVIEAGKRTYYIEGSFKQYTADNNVAKIVITDNKTMHEYYRKSAAYLISHRLLKSHRSILRTSVVGFDNSFNLCLVVSRMKTDLLKELTAEEIPKWKRKDGLAILHQMADACEHLQKQANRIHLVPDLRPNNIYLNFDESQNEYVAKLNMCKLPDVTQPYPDPKQTEPFHYHFTINKGAPPDTSDPQLSWQLLVLAWLLQMKTLYAPPWTGEQETGPNWQTVLRVMQENCRDITMITDYMQLGNWFNNRDLSVSSIKKHCEPRNYNEKYRKLPL